jgi:Actinobacteria/chloroflexi VLRF1 release factor
VPQCPVESRRVVVPWSRLPGWIERFSARHPGTAWQLTATSISAAAPDGAQADFDVPFPPLSGPTLTDLERHLVRPWHVGYLLVRRGGFAVARTVGADQVAMKVSRRHVQGRTKAGGWSQQRFARRRDNQAQAVYDSAIDQSRRLLVPYAAGMDLLAVGGDRRAVAGIVQTPSLAPLRRVERRHLQISGDPTADMLTRAVEEVRSVTIEIHDPLLPGWTG